jgi:D-apionolactonase
VSAAAPPTSLRAGALSARLMGAALRHVRLGGVEVVREIAVAVRDPEWGTVPAELSGVVLHADPDGRRFTVTFDARHRDGDIDFSWRGEIAGDAERLRFTMDGAATAAFAYRRIGICVLHPSRTSCGRMLAARGPGGPHAQRLPTAVAPQDEIDGINPPLFPAFEWLSIAFGDGLDVEFAFDGDLFEMEDQRNWTDASLKSYSQRPLSAPEPTPAGAGERFRQAVTLSWRGAVDDPAPATDTVTLTLGPPLGRRPPRLGTARTVGRPPLRASHPLADAHLAHLRVDVWPDRSNAADELDAGLADARASGMRLELALHLAEPEGHRDALRALAAAVSEADLARVLVYVDGCDVTPAAAMRHVRDALGAVAGATPTGGGAELNFAELNRVRPAPAPFDVLCFALSPTVHADDDEAIMSTLEAQRAVMATAALFDGGRPVVVSPITLREHERAGLRPPDPRQGSVFAAAWAVGSVKALGEAGATALTLFETVGLRGLVDDGPTPALHALWDVAELADGEIVAGWSSDPGAAQILALRRGARRRLIVLGLRAEPTSVAVGPVVGRVRIRSLDERSAGDAARDPAGFRASGRSVRAEGQVRLELDGYTVACLDVDEQGAAP